MPGILWSARPGGLRMVPEVGSPWPPLANSLSGTVTSGTYPNITALPQINFGDLVVLTTKSTLTSGSTPVIRQLLAGDVTNLYQVTTPTSAVAGIFGVAMDYAATTATGTFSPTAPSLGGTNYAYPTTSGEVGADPASGRALIEVALFKPGQIFTGRLYTGGGNITLANQYNYTAAGFNLSMTAGVTTYTIDPAATTKVVTILGPVVEDPLYNELVLSGAAAGPLVYFTALAAFAQSVTSAPYTAN